jgi:soluble lytic murein transglycosylase-like protein
VVVTPKSVEEIRVAGAVVAPRVAAPASTGTPGRAADLDEAVERIASEHAVSPQLIHSVIRAESNYDSGAVSPKGALGLMQLIPATARRFGVSDVFDPVENIQGGVKYLRYLLDLYDGDYPLVLAAYNAGEGAVTRYGGVPPFPETRNYVARVSRNLKEAKPAAGKSVVANPAAPVVTEGSPSGPNHIAEIVEPDGSVRYVSR